jgi:hypothetical protein
MTFNLSVSYRHIGGLHFIKIGRITLMWCVSKPARSLRARSLTTVPATLALEGLEA